MGQFYSAMRSHDWYYQYSDCHSVWDKGCRERDTVRKLHEKLNCPFSMDVLCAFIHDFVLEKFYEHPAEGSGKWYRTGCQYGPKVIAATYRKELITQAEVDAIQAWLKEHDTDE